MKILISYDESKLSEKVLEVAKNQAKAQNAQVIIANSMKGGIRVPRESFEKSEKMLKEAKHFLEKNGIASETHLFAHGHEPGEDMIRYADENAVDLIIIGIEKKSKVGKLLFGSTAQYIILKASCPVLTVG